MRLRLEAVDDDDVVSLFEQPRDEMGTDEAGPAGDERSHLETHT
jgi:hypothetical protein